jgi:malonyl-CoA O-methyltransferase
MTKSSIVAKNFSRNPDYYHLRAETQLLAAANVAELIAAQNINPQQILEIGCGTGFLTDKLFDQFPEAEFTVTDISAAMLEFCQKQTAEIREQKGISAKFAENDICTDSPPGHFDLITSSLAFQWVPDLSGLFKRLQEKLTSEGKIICSTLAEGTFATVKQRFSTAGVDFPSPKLFADEEIKTFTRFFNSVEIFSETCHEKFASMRDFLHHIQETGAGNASGKALSSVDLKKILKAEDMPVNAEYNIKYLVLSN